MKKFKKIFIVFSGCVTYINLLYYFLLSNNSKQAFINLITLIFAIRILFKYKKSRENNAILSKIQSLATTLNNLEEDKALINNELISLSENKDSLNLEIINLQSEKRYIIDKFRQEAFDGYLEKLKSDYADEIKESNENLISMNKALQTEYDKLSLTYKDLKNEYDNLNSLAYGITPTEFEFEKSETYNMKLNNIRLKEKQFISKLKNKKPDEIFIKISNLEKLSYNYFNVYCNNNLNKLTYNNYPQRIKAVEQASQKIKNLTEDKIIIPDTYKKLKEEELEASFAYYKKKEEEKEILRLQREQERDDIKAQQELKEKQAKINKEIESLELTEEKLKIKIFSAKDKEIEKLKLQLEKLRQTISYYKDQKSDIDYRVENLGAGYVYIISNIGSFGKEIYKIGVTRRLDPYERIRELSSASVPFKFDVHAMIFSYQAYQLEAELHRYFDSRRVNKVNPRKEFFNININEIKNILKVHKELTFDFVEEAKAEEYKESLAITK